MPAHGLIRKFIAVQNRPFRIKHPDPDLLCKTVSMVHALFLPGYGDILRTVMPPWVPYDVAV